MEIGASTALRYSDSFKDDLFNVSIKRIGLTKKRIKIKKRLVSSFSFRMNCFE